MNFIIFPDVGQAFSLFFRKSGLKVNQVKSGMGQVKHTGSKPLATGKIRRKANFQGSFPFCFEESFVLEMLNSLIRRHFRWIKDRHLRSKSGRNLIVEERIVRTGQQEGINPMDLHGIHIFLDGFLHFRTTKFFTFNERHKFWTAKAKHFNTGVKTLNFPLMGPGGNRKVRRKKPTLLLWVTSLILDAPLAMPITSKS